MNIEFPYQLVAFLNKEPLVGESVYYGENGWYPQIALKRRFKIVDTNEDDFFDKLEDYLSKIDCFTIKSNDVTKPERMPVKMIEVEPSPELMGFHNDFIVSMGDNIVSRYPERDGDNYLPHVTVEYNGEMVIDPKRYINQEFSINRVCLLKDVAAENSVAYRFFNLHE